MILTITSQAERFTNMVEKKLELPGRPFYRFNLDVESLKATRWSATGDDVVIVQNGRELRLSTVERVWCKRTRVEVPIDETDDGNCFRLWRDEWNRCLAHTLYFLEAQGVAWLDSPDVLRKAERKQRQLDLARRVGLRTPETLISNDKKAIVEFARRFERCVMKAQTQPSFLSDGEIYVLYANVVDAETIDREFDRYENSPAIFQGYVRKKYEARYTVVGDKHFVCRIENQRSERAKEDWRRYDLARTPHRAVEPPKEVRQKTSDFMKAIGLTYGALDFIVDENDDWIFLEANPVGQYGWIETLTGLPITDAIVERLTERQGETGNRAPLRRV